MIPLGAFGTTEAEINTFKNAYNDFLQGRKRKTQGVKEI